MNLLEQEVIMTALDEKSTIKQVIPYPDSDSKNYIILGNGSKFIYPDSFFQGYLVFSDRNLQNKLNLKFAKKTKQDNLILKIKGKRRNRYVVPYKFTKNKVAYKYTYFSDTNIKLCNAENLKIRSGILSYKDSTKIDHKEWRSKFTHDLFELIANVIKYELLSPDEVYLVAIPPSKTNKDSTIKTSIKSMVSWSNKGILKREFACDTKLIDYSDAIVRKEDTEEEKSGSRSTWLQKQTMEVVKPFDRESIVILVDDITTTGTIMYACKNLLMSKGVQEECISMVAIAETYFNENYNGN